MINQLIRSLWKVSINLLIVFGGVIIWETEGFWGLAFGILMITIGDIAMDFIPRFACQEAAE